MPDENHALRLPPDEGIAAGYERETILATSLFD